MNGSIHAVLDQPEATQLDGSVVGALPPRLCVLDGSGFILTVNAPWQAFEIERGAQNSDGAVGANYLDECDRDASNNGAMARKCATGIRAVIGQRQQDFALEYFCHLPGKNRWFLCTAIRFDDAERVRVLVSHSDITERVRAQSKYNDSERKFHSLADLSADAYWETDKEHRFTLAIWSADQPELVEQSDWILAGSQGKTRWEIPFLEASADQWQQHKDDLSQRRKFRNFEIKRVHDDETRYFSISGHPVFDVAGLFQGYRGISRDITERRQAQARIEHLNRVYSLLSGINTLIVRATDQDTLFKAACQIAVEKGGFKMAVLGVVNDKLASIDLVASAGADADHLASLQSLMSMRDDSPLGHNAAVQAVKKRVATVINDAVKDERVILKQAHALRGIRSMVSLPILVGDKVFGVFILFAAESGFFDDAEMRLLYELAGDIAFAIENLAKQQRLTYLKRVTDFASAINALIARAENRGQLFRDACEVAVHQGGFPLALLGILDPIGANLVLGGLAGKSPQVVEFTRKIASSGSIKPNPMVAQAIKEKRPVISNDSQNDARVAYGDKHVEFAGHSLAILPIVVSNVAIGVLALYAKERDFFHEEEVKLLQELIGDISFAVDHLDKVERLDYLAYFDVLTGLANRRLLLERLAQHMRDAASHTHKLALFLVDLDRFKNLNDSLGRLAGDAILKHVADWLAHDTGDVDLVGRVSGDQFAVILPRIPDGTELDLLIDRMLSALDLHYFRANDVEYRIAAKVGAAIFPDDASASDSLLQNAEAALKIAKKTGERTLFYSARITEAVGSKLTLENQLRRALDRNEFVLFYQPKVGAVTGELVGAEALIRWNHPQRGIVPPNEFIPVLEETGLIYNVGRWVIAQAISDHLDWRKSGLHEVRIAVNVSSLQLRNRAFVDEIRSAISVAPGAASGLELEITESVVMNDIDTNIANLERVRAMGVTIALDDFGTGFSSLSYLSRLPLDNLKIDRLFVIDMTERSAGLALVSAVITLSHALNLKVVAEGVETEEQSRLLRLLGCDTLQGYLYGRPVPRDVFRTTHLGQPAASGHTDSGPRP